MWLDAQVQLKETTRSGYRHALDKHALPTWGHFKIGDVSHADVQAWVSRLSLTLGPSAVRQTHLVLSGELKYAVRDGRLAQYSREDVRLPRLAKRARRYLSHEQAAMLVGELEGHGDVALFPAYAGLRWG